VEIETPKASRREGYGERVSPPQPTMGSGGASSPSGENEFWEYLELEKIHLTATNVSYLKFLRHIFSHIHIHNY